MGDYATKAENSDLIPLLKSSIEQVKERQKTQKVYVIMLDDTPIAALRDPNQALKVRKRWSTKLFPLNVFSLLIYPDESTLSAYIESKSADQH